MRLWISSPLWLSIVFTTHPLHAAQETTVEVHQRLTNQFIRADTNKDRKLSLNEFLVGRDNAVVATRDFRLGDFNEDQHLTLEEYLAVPTVVEARHRGPLPDLMTGFVEQIVTALDAACDGWDQEPNREITRREFLEHLDRQTGQSRNDGILNDDPQMDPNRNGTITRAEARRYLEILMGVRNSEGAVLRYPNGEVVKFAFFLDSESNPDNQLDEEEFVEGSRAWSEVAQDFTQVDSDRNGYVSATEWVFMQGRPIFDPVEEFCQMDTNLDARLDSGELLSGIAASQKPLARRVFPGFDWNGDGVLSLAEYRTTMLANPVLPWQNRMYDRDDDGSLDLREFAFDLRNHFAFLRMMYFRRLDRNGDQRLDSNEWTFVRRQPDEFFVLNEDGTGWTSLYRFDEYKACATPTVSPDGDTLAFTAFSPHRPVPSVFLMPLEGGKPRLLETGSWPSWHPDGKTLICSRMGNSKPGIYLMDIERPFEAHWIAPGRSGAWKSNGAQIAIADENAIRLFDVDRNSFQPIAQIGADLYRHVQGAITWSPRGQKLCLIGHRHTEAREVLTCDFSADKPELKLRHRQRGRVNGNVTWHPRGNLAWHPIRNRVTFSAWCLERKQTQLYEFDPTNDAPPKLVEGQDPARNNTDACWTPDGKRLIVISGDY